MKKKLLLLALATVMTTAAHAASIDHIQTYTPEYLGNQAQNGMVNGASVYYNPAGLVHLKNGTYVHAGAELAIGHEKMEYNGHEYKAILLQPIPNFAAYKVQDNSALYWTFGGIGGGGDLNYKSGVAGTAVVPDIIKNSELGHFFKSVEDAGSSAEGKNIYAQTTLGKAWKVDNKLSVSVGGRVVYGVRNLKGDLNINTTTDKQAIKENIANQIQKEINNNPKFAEAMKNPEFKKHVYEKLGSQMQDAEKQLKHIHADIDSERTAWGYGFQLGLNYKATDRLNLAMRYDSRVKLNFKARGTMNNFKTGIIPGILPDGIDLGFEHFYPEYKPGHKQRRDLPAILALGASYKVTDDWTMALAGNYYFNKDAKMDRIVPGGKLGNKELKGFEAQYDNGWEIALGTEYKLNPQWAFLGSVNYANTGAKKEAFDDVEYPLNSLTLGTGLKYNPDEDTEWVFAISHFIYFEKGGHYNEKYDGVVPNPKYDKSITAFGLSYTKRF